MIRPVLLCFAIGLGITPSGGIAKDRSAPATPKGSPGDWFPPNSYPAESKRKREQGRVSIQLKVNRLGVPIACKIVGSSGFPGLDLSTCNLAIANAKFVPARDPRGQPTEATYDVPAVRWELGDESTSMDLTSGTATTTLRNVEITVDEQGKGVSCQSLASAAGVNVGCEQFVVGSGITPPLQVNGKPVAGKVTITTTMRVDPK
jgi:TonB family protein